jgi:metal-responsive CopG/Arc/MetJ family transcriptional regulator
MPNDITISVRLPVELNARMERVAPPGCLNRSGFIKAAVQHELDRLTQEHGERRLYPEAGDADTG